MTELQYGFLTRYVDGIIANSGSLAPSDRAVFRSCKDNKYVEIRILPGNVWAYRISDKGRHAMLEFEHGAKKAAEEKAEHAAKEAEQEAAAQTRWKKDAARSWIQFGLNALFGLLGLICGVLLEHYFALLELIFALF